MELTESELARDKALQDVSDSHEEWIGESLSLVELICPGWEGTGEDIRGMIPRKPRDPHAWGALINTACRRGLLEDTGRIQNMQAVKSHARRTPVWRRTWR